MASAHQAARVMAASGALALSDAGLADDPFVAVLGEFAEGAAPVEMSAAIEHAKDHVSWSKYQLTEWTSRLADRSKAATMVGPFGTLDHDSLAFGYYHVRPNAVYHEHGHAAREVYLILEGEVDFLSADRWQLLGPGEVSVQEPEVVHGLQTRNQPIVCFWAWTGDVASPIWGLDESGKKFYPTREAAPRP